MVKVQVLRVPVIDPNTGKVLTVVVTSPGSGYKDAPKVKIIDNTNYGKGATAKQELRMEGK